MLTLAILNYNGKDYLEECLSSIPATIQAERLLIDNASTDDSWKIAEKYAFRVIHADNRHKFLTGINTALASANGDYILFSQGDVKFGYQAIERMCQVAQVYDHAIIQPLFLRDNEIDNAGMNLIWPGYGIGKHSNGKGFGAYETGVCTSITFLMPRPVLDIVGFYDINFSPAYYEDADWALRSKKLGVKHLVANGSIVHHRHNESFGKFYKKKEISDICRKNRKYLIKKHYKGIDKWTRLITLEFLDFFVVLFQSSAVEKIFKSLKRKA